MGKREIFFIDDIQEYLYEQFPGTNSTEINVV